MHIKKTIDLPTILCVYQPLIDASNSLGGQAILNGSGSILLSNDLNLGFPLSVHQNLEEILAKFQGDFNPLIFRTLTETTSSYHQKIKLKIADNDLWFQLLISPVGQDGIDLFFVQFINVTEVAIKEIYVQKQQDRIENELLLRTREIIHTDQFIKNEGGFLQNFMRGLRHDLVSPIAQLKDIIEYYKKTDNPEKKERAEALIDISIDKLSHTAKGFSNFVDLHFLPEKSFKEIEIKEIYEDTIAVLDHAIKQSDAQIEFDFLDSNGLKFDKKIMDSIFYNLISNAIKFRRKTEALKINIRTYKKGKHFYLTIKDNGIGIDLVKNQQYLFLPFKRFTMDIPGAGIGLSMLKNVLTKYKGNIQIESQLDQGTTVTVVLPLVVQGINS